jgi:hypothetical protein
VRFRNISGPFLNQSSLKTCTDSLITTRPDD